VNPTLASDERDPSALERERLELLPGNQPAPEPRHSCQVGEGLLAQPAVQVGVHQGKRSQNPSVEAIGLCGRRLARTWAVL